MSTPPALPPIYATTPLRVVPHTLIATFPAPTFLENLVVAADGTLFITNHEVGEVLRLAPAGEPTVLARLDGKVTGITLAPNDDVILTGWDSAGTPVIVSVTPTGTVQLRATLPTAQFLNGITPLTADTYLTADSYRGAIWRFD
ncbi:MAG TPA: hypothetical protein V6D02_00195, partial [Candidatus Obscuribacterales bacterium]